MNILHKIAKPCGILGGIWGILASLLALLLMMYKLETTIILISTGVMGVLGILGIVLSGKRFRLGIVLIWVSAIAILAGGLLSGPYFFLPASILLIIAAIGLSRSSELAS